MVAVQAGGLYIGGKAHRLAQGPSVRALTNASVDIRKYSTKSGGPEFSATEARPPMMPSSLFGIDMMSNINRGGKRQSAQRNHHRAQT
jgi:hypothetical protein